jgi:predicted transcriptional regulator
MTITLDIPDDLRARVDAIAARSNLSASQVVADALENGHSLEWQEMFLEKVARGIADADRGAFASDAEVDAVVSKYRSA